LGKGIKPTLVGNVRLVPGLQEAIWQNAKNYAKCQNLRNKESGSGFGGEGEHAGSSFLEDLSKKF